MPEPPTVVLSLGRSSNPRKRTLEQSLIEHLSVAVGIELIVTPHLYDWPETEAATTLQAVEGDLIVLAWLYPRATYWTLRQAGVSGQLGQTPTTATDSIDTPTRPIHCIDLRDSDSSETHLAAVEKLVSSRSTDVNLRPAGAAQRDLDKAPRAPKTTRRRWYPVIDVDRCTNCLECIDFCLFGVYGVDRAEKILVEQPDNCRQGCPACSRVCPANAIMFPQHKTPSIAGDPTAVGGLKLDLSDLFEGVSPAELAQSERNAHLLAPDTPEATRPRRMAAEPDPLDQMLDELDQFDS